MLGALEYSSGTGLKHQIIDLTVVAWFYHGVLEKRNELFEPVKFVNSMHGNRICLNFSMAHRKPGLLSYGFDFFSVCLTCDVQLTQRP